jgi:hypothetical protein
VALALFDPDTMRSLSMSDTFTCGVTLMARRLGHMDRLSLGQASA